MDQLVKNNSKFDIVFCVGVLHHVTDAVGFIESLSKICNKYIFLEFITYVNPVESLNILTKTYFKKKHKNNELKQVEMKDLIYNTYPKIYGRSIHKFESDYFDGSSINTSIVCLPDYNLVRMALLKSGIESRLLISSNNYKTHLKSKKRKFNAVIMSGKVESKLENSGSYIELEEELYTLHCLPNLSLKFLNILISKSKFSKALRTQDLLISKVALKGILQLLILFSREIDRNIIRNISHAPESKVRFEISKNLILNGYIQEGRESLLGLLNSPNLDWRVTYRSVALLYCFSTKSERELWQKRLFTANSHYPIKILDNFISN